MVQGTDEPLLPEDFHQLLVEAASVKEWTTEDDDRRVDAQRAYLRGVSALKYFMSAGGEAPSKRNRIERSRLGPYYPATNW